jgi:hypothetical protein
MKRLIAPALLLLAGTASALPAQPAQTTRTAQTEGRRISHLVVYGSDPCPASVGDEIVVCARRPEDDRYRIPESLRGTGRPLENSWAANARTLEFVGRAGLQSCSTSGPNGFTGCWEEMMRQWEEERDGTPDGQPVP